jgi:hypothetical protein
MMIGDFARLFGSSRGRQLQAWCVSRGWPLVWALGAAGDDMHNSNASAPVGLDRVVDPLVQLALAANHSPTALNVSGDVLRGSAAAFRGAQAAVNASRPATNTTGGWRAEWRAFVAGLPQELLVRPLLADHCADADRCIGRNAKKQCVCK